MGPAETSLLVGGQVMPPQCVLARPPLCGAWGEGSGRPSFPYKDTGPIGLGPHTYDLM